MGRLALSLSVLLGACAGFRAPALVLHAQLGLRRAQSTSALSEGTRTSLGASLVMPLDAPPPLTRSEDPAPVRLLALPPPARCREPGLCEWERAERERALERVSALARLGAHR